MANKKQNTPDTKKSEVSRAPRTNIAARAAYKDPNSLDIPADMETYFKSQGYKLRWIRIVDPKTHSHTNERVNHILSIGGDIVSPAEIKDINPAFLNGLTKYDYREDFADEDDRAKNAQVGIKKQDLMLMKLPLEYVEYKRQVNREMVEEQLTAAQYDYKRQGGKEVFVENFKHGSANVKLGKGFFE